MEPTKLRTRSGRCQLHANCGSLRILRRLALAAALAALMMCPGDTRISPDPGDDVQGFHPGDPIDPAAAIEVIAEAGEDQEVDELSECWLDGRFSTGSGTPGHSRIQIVGETVELSQNDQPQVSFVVPPPSNETEVLKSQLVVQLTADTADAADSGRVVKNADDIVRIIAKGRDFDGDGLTGK